jgi:translocation and assembly module TamA
MQRSRLALLLTWLLVTVALPAAAEIKVSIEGVEGDERSNVLTRLSVWRYRDNKDVDEDTMRRLFNRIDGEVKNALRPFGYYEPTVAADRRAAGKDWQVAIAIKPGEPVRVSELNVSVEGPGADDAAFDSVKNQDLIRLRSRLHHGAYEKLKSSMLQIAEDSGYRDARMVKSEMLVDTTAHAANITLELETGPRYRFGKIDIQQTNIRPELMQRFLRFKEDDPYNARQVLLTQFALDDSQYFSRVDVEPGTPDSQTLTVPVSITATKSRPTFSIGAGYGTDTGVRGTLGWTDKRVNDRGHRFRIQIQASAKKRELNSRYDIPIGDPALERMSLEAQNVVDNFSDINTHTTAVTPSITQVHGRWQTVTSVSATRTTTYTANPFTSNLLVPGIVLASVPQDFLGQELFSRTFYVELIGSHSVLGSDANFLRLHIQSEHTIDLSPKWHLLLRGEIGASLVQNYSELPGIYRFYAGGDYSVRGFAYHSLSPKDPASGDNIGGKDLLVGSVEIDRDIPWNMAVATFFDFGNAYNSFRDPLEYAAGVGVRYRLPGVSIGLDVAKPLSTSGNLRLHLNISPQL